MIPGRQNLTGLVAALVFVGLPAIRAEAADTLTEAQQIAKLVHLLREEDVTHYPPEELVRDAQQTPRFLGLATSEAGEDHFFQAYEKKLRPLTDKRFPRAAQVRTKLVEVFILANDFCEGLFGSGTGFGHHHDRIPGYIESYLYSGFDHGFSDPFGRRYTLDDIRSVGVLIVRANWEERTTVLVDGPRDVASALRAGA